MKVTYTYSFRFLLACCLCASLYVSADANNATFKGFDFIENKGQWEQQARYKADIPGGAFFITDKGFVYSYTSAEDVERIGMLRENLRNAKSDKAQQIADELNNATIRHHAYRVNFVGANKQVSYSRYDKRSYYHNYFLGRDTSKWRGDVRLFGRIEQQNIYDGVDLAVYSKDNHLKYDFIVAPQADASKIALAFEGIAPEITREGNLKIKTSINEVMEKAPYAYQVIDGKEVAVKCNYMLVDGEIHFEMPAGYDNDYSLIIDPTLVFATYHTGGPINTRRFGGLIATTYDAAGNLYSAAGTISNTWPATIGAFQTIYMGTGGAPPLGSNLWTNGDLFISKFNSTGTSLIYATYLGGSFEDVVYRMAVDDQGELIVSGATLSQDFPVTNNCFDSHLDSLDLFVTHFNSTGTGLIGSTLIGGSKHDGYTWEAFPAWPNSAYALLVMASYEVNPDVNWGAVLGMTLDRQGNILVGSITNSPDFPVTSNAAQANYKGMLEGIIFKLSSDCSQLLYSSYLGGAERDGIKDVKLNNAGNIVVCGSTLGSNFPVTPNAYQTHQGNVDGFVAIISSSTGDLLHSTLLGTSLPETGVAVDIDASDNVYITGNCFFGQYPVTPGVYSQPNGGMYVHKLTPDLSTTLLSTTLSHPAFYQSLFFFTVLVRPFIHGFRVDPCGRAYFHIGEWELSELPVTANAFSSTRVLGGYSHWVGVLNEDFSTILYGSFLTNILGGSPYWTKGTSSYDKNSELYATFCVRGNSTLVATTPGAYAAAPYPNIDETYASVKIDLSEYVKQQMDTITAKSTVTCCFVNGVRLSAKDTLGYNYKWSNGELAPHTQVTIDGVYVVTYSRPGTPCVVYVDTLDVKLSPFPVVKIETKGSCFGGGSGTVKVHVSQNNQRLYTYTFSDASGNLIQTTQSSTGTQLEGLNPGSYRMQIQIPTGCDTTILFAIDTLPAPKASFTADSVICVGYETQIENTSIGDFLTWYWDLGNGITPTAFSPANISYTSTGIYNVMLVMTNEVCSDTFIRSIEVVEFTLQLSANDDVVGFNEAIDLKTSAAENYTVYSWMPGWLFTDQAAKEQRLVADSSRSYIVIGKSDLGCIDTAAIAVSVYPLVYVPSAFTPNGDGKNDYFRPVGTNGKFKIGVFRIYDRWGKVVWVGSGTDAIRGWDGTYNGTPVELGTYLYTIEIEDSKGNSTLRTGDVTLVR